MKQKRSEHTYQKINTLYKRNEKGLIMIGEFSDPNFGYLYNNLWDIEEKIDGTNIRIEITLKNDSITDNTDKTTILSFYEVEYKGKTDNANIPPKLLKYLQETYPKNKVLNALNLPLNPFVKSEEDIYPNKIIIYGEGYGAKIQSCGGNYLSNDNSFIIFDIKIDDWWLLRETRNEIAEKLQAPVVPYLGYLTLADAEELVKTGFISYISENRNFLAEGIVARIPTGLKNRKGERLIVKIKTCDYNKLNSN